jgi:hypothetical protein
LRVALALALLATAACGKKGPPLAPVVRVPAAVDRLEARRSGGDVYITLTIPAQNVDESTPADIGRVEIYGYTGRTPPSKPRWVEFATLVATVPIAPFVEDATVPPGDPVEGAVQGSSVTVRDTLSPDELVQGPIEPPPVRRGIAPTSEAAGHDVPLPPLRRFYLAVPFSPRDRNGPPGAVAELHLDALPDAPQAVQARYTQNEIAVSWEPSGGLIGYLFERELPPEPPPAEDFDVAPPAVEPQPAAPSGPTRYNVYRDPPAVSVALPPAPAEPWNQLPEAPLNPEPLTTTMFSDDVEFGRERCYTVRAVRGARPQAVESEPSARACVTPVDVFAPAAPTAVAAVAAEGAISLIWDATAEPDLGGYLVLRGRAGDVTLQPLTTTPLTEPRYRDVAVVPGVRYVYAVVAVDTAMPPNVSLESERIEETAR